MLGLSAGLAIVVGLEWQGVAETPSPGVIPEPMKLRLPVTERSAPVIHTAAWAETTLARPLFAPGRRPGVSAPAPLAVSVPLPRLAGVIIDGSTRRAIFAGAEGKAVLAQVGGIIAGFTIQTIEPGQVTLASADGPRTLRPSFDSQTPIPVNPALFAAVPTVASLRAGRASTH